MNVKKFVVIFGINLEKITQNEYYIIRDGYIFKSFDSFRQILLVEQTSL